MKTVPAFFAEALLGLVLTLAPACVTTSTTSTLYTPEDPTVWVRSGRVQWVREVVEHQQGNPAGGALAGGLAGGLLGGAIGHSAGGALLGAVGGAVVGAAVSQGSAERRHYEVMVRFDDGGYRMFAFEGPAPQFRPGMLVLLTPDGLRTATAIRRRSDLARPPTRSSPGGAGARRTAMVSSPLPPCPSHRLPRPRSWRSTSPVRWPASTGW
jgi:outer membrane lipoprotein SlyB